MLTVANYAEMSEQAGVPEQNKTPQVIVKDSREEGEVMSRWDGRT